MFWPRLASGLLASLVLLWIFGPRDRLRTDAVGVDRPADPQVWLNRREAGIRSEVASYLQWAGQPGQVADLAILYVHGFSASPAELRPLPEDLARSLGANLLAIRLQGHGQGGDELAAARAEDWWRDVAQGLAIARGMGRRVIVLGTSTGATLAALAARDPQMGKHMDGIILVSPNFGLRARGAWMLDLPFARHILRLLGDPTRCFATRSDMHRARWTHCYPVSAALPVGVLVRTARRGTYENATQPALFIWSDADLIVDHYGTAKVAAAWGGPVTVVKTAPERNDDPDAHVLAGEALSPGMTASLASTIGDWIRQIR